MLYVEILALIQQSFLCYQVFDKQAEGLYKALNCGFVFVQVFYLAVTIYKGVTDTFFPSIMMSELVLIAIITNHTYFRRREMKEVSGSTTTKEPDVAPQVK